jgi:succinate dehydrogenase / fumarate reductase flavoprotein subunit
LIREESRAAHYREDFPENDEDWRKNIVYWKGPNSHMITHNEDVGPVPKAIQDALDEEHELDYHHLE